MDSLSLSHSGAQEGADRGVELGAGVRLPVGGEKEPRVVDEALHAEGVRAVVQEDVPVRVLVEAERVGLPENVVQQNAIGRGIPPVGRGQGARKAKKEGDAEGEPPVSPPVFSAHGDVYMIPSMFLSTSELVTAAEG